MKKYTDISLDLETLSTRPDAAILSIGVVPFNRGTGEIGEGAEIHVKIFPQLFSRHVMFSTIKWWVGQSKEAISQAAVGQRTAYKLKEALALLRTVVISWAVDENEVKVWGNGAAFDNAILIHAYKQKKYPCAWKYWNDLCLRTIETQVEDKDGSRLKDLVPFVGTKHNALADAEHQAKLVIKGYQILGLNAGATEETITKYHGKLSVFETEEGTYELIDISSRSVLGDIYAYDGNKEGKLDRLKELCHFFNLGAGAE
jgi:exodeoxyribonuclease VIII